MNKKSYSYSKGSYGVYTNDVEPHDAYVALLQEEAPTIEDDSLSAMASEQEPISTQQAYEQVMNSEAGRSVEPEHDDFSQIVGEGTAEATAATPATSSDPSKTVQNEGSKSWKDLLRENKGRLFVIALISALAWLFFSKD